MARHTKEMFEHYLLETVGTEYSALGDYVNARTPLLIRHNICGTEYLVRTDDFKRGKRCPQCMLALRGRKRAKSPEEFRAEVFSLVGDEYTVLDEYYTWDTKLRIKHNKCGNVYKVQPNAFLCGRRCPKCKSSHGELLVSSILKSLGVPFEIQKSFEDLKGTGGRRLSYDFFLPEHNIFIEYQGKQHYKAIPLYGGEVQFEVQKEHDARKKEYVSKLGGTLLEIPYTKVNKEQIESMIKEELSQSVKQGTS